jgi:hypothetical protein
VAPRQAAKAEYRVMGTVALRARFARGLELARDNAAMLAIFATALFLSAPVLLQVWIAAFDQALAMPLETRG